MIVPDGLQLRLDPQDEYTHVPEDVRNYNESMYFEAWDTATGLGAWMRLGNRPNEGRAEMTICVHLPDGRVGFMFGRPEISGNEAMDAGGLRFDVIEPFKRLRTRYQGELLVMTDSRAMLDPSKAFKTHPKVAATLDLMFEGLSPMMGGELVTPDGRRAVLDPDKATFRGHTEQHMAITGRITVDGQSHEMNGLGYRDKSWGPRHWHSLYWYRWLPVTFNREFGFFMCLNGRQGHPAHPSGHVFHDGILDPIVRVHLDTDWDEQGLHRGFVARVSTASREYVLQARSRALVPLRHKQGNVPPEEVHTRITKAMTDYTCEGYSGIGMSEYGDQIVRGMAISRTLGEA